MLNIAIFLLVFSAVGLPIYVILSNSKNNWQKMLGDSFFIGVFVVVVVLNFIQFLQLNLNMVWFFRVVLIYAIVGLLLLLLLYRKKIRLAVQLDFSLYEQAKANIYYILAFVIVALHVYHIVLQNSTMPLIAWDAWNGWVAKAKIWYYHGLSEPIINRFIWLQSDSVLTNPIAHYPDGLPLLYLFASGLVGWNETELNALYPSLMLALIFSFYGNIKILTQSRQYAWLALLMLVTIPLLNMHVVLAGYADIWVAAFLMLTVFYAQLFLLQPKIKSLIAMLLLSLTLVMFKLESWVWLVIFYTAFGLSLLSHKKRKWVFIISVIIFVIWWFIGGLSVHLPIGEIIIQPDLIQIPFLGSYELTFNNTSVALLEAIFYSNSWGLLWYLAPILLILPFCIKQKSTMVLPGLFLCFTVFFLFVLFYMTYASSFATDFTSSNRLLLHIVPVYIYLLVQMLSQYQKRKNHKNFA